MTLERQEHKFRSILGLKICKRIRHYEHGILQKTNKEVRATYRGILIAFYTYRRSTKSSKRPILAPVLVGLKHHIELLKLLITFGALLR